MLESWETGEAESSQDVNNKTKIKKQEQENTEEIKKWKEMKIKWNEEWFFKASLVCLSLITFSSSHFRQKSPMMVFRLSSSTVYRAIASMSSISSLASFLFCENSALTPFLIEIPRNKTNVNSFFFAARCYCVRVCRQCGMTAKQKLYHR